MTTRRLAPSGVAPLGAPVGFAVAFVAVSLIASGGCNTVAKKPTQSISGKILQQKKPVEGAYILFWPAVDDKVTPRPHAISGAGGVFLLGTYADNDGAPPGDYVVTVVWPEPAHPSKEEPGRQQAPDSEESPRDRLNGRYADHRTSPLKVTIRPGATEIDPIHLH